MRFAGIAQTIVCVFATVMLCANVRAQQIPHGIGVNYFDCFYRTLKDANDRSYEKGFAELSKRKIPFARFMCGGYWPSEWKLYLTNPDVYFRLLDGVIESARQNHVGLIPSLFLNPATVPDLVHESLDQWGDPRSQTTAFALKYAKRVVERYRGDRTIVAWEFGNEFNLLTDLPNASTHRPAIQPQLGTPTTRTAHDELTSDQSTIALIAFATEVHKLDSNRPILSGNSIPRASAWHQLHERSWTRDTDDQQAQMLIAQNPPPLDMFCIHVYEDDDISRLPLMVKTALAQHRPLIVEEFGAEEKGDSTRRRFESLLEKVEAANVAASALWVYDFSHQPEWNVTAGNVRAYQLDAISAVNRSMDAHDPQ